MIKKKVQVTNPSGLHLRPAGNLFQEAQKYRSDISIVYSDGTANAKSLLSILCACVKCGDEVELVCEGEDEKIAMKALLSAIRSGLGE